MSEPRRAPRTRYPGQGVLVALIRAYRGRVSGRGPLRRVRCTFAHTESCSAYGLRVATAVARSAPQALRLVRARIRACGRTALYRIPLPDGSAGRDHGLLWGEAFDPGAAAHDQALRAAGELPATRAAVLRAHARIARHGHDLHAMQRYLAAAHALAPGHATLVVRAGHGLPAGLRRRLHARIAALAALAGLLWVLAPPWLAAPVTLCALALACAGARGLRRRLRRLDHLAAASRFHAPMRAPAWPRPAAPASRAGRPPAAPARAGLHAG